MHRSRPLRLRVATLTSVADLAVATLLGPGTSAVAAPGTRGAPHAAKAAKPADPTTVVAVAGAGESFGAPAALTTAAGTSLLSYYRQGPAVTRVLEIQRQTGTGGWTSVALAQGGLDTFGVPSLVEDAATGRVLLTASANASGDLAGTLGTYLWWSADQGATWSAPIKVWNSFGVGDAAPDGSGGFYSTSGQTDAQIIHVPSGYTMVTAPAGATRLTDKLGSRGALGLVTAGPSYSPIFGFYTTSGVFAHRGATYDPALDTQVFAVGSLGSLLGVAGSSTGAALATSHTPGYAASGTSALWVRGLDPASGALGPEQRLSKGQTLFFQLRSLPSTSTFAAVWRDNGDGDLYVARAAKGADGDWSTSRIIDDSADAVSYYSNLDISSRWAVGLGNRDSDSAGVVWAAKASPETVLPTLALKGKAAYSSKRGTIKARTLVNSSGRVKVVATVKVPGRKSIKVTTSKKSTGYGTYPTTLKVPRAARTLLGTVPKASIKVVITFVNAAGSTRLKPKVKG